MSKDHVKTVELAHWGSLDERKKAIEACSVIPYCFRALVANLEHEDREIREAAARSLGFLGLKESVEPLRQAIEKEQNEKVKSVMIWALGSTRVKNSREHAQYLEPMLNDKNPVIRRSVAFALGALRQAESLSPLKNRAQNEENEWVKVELYRSILAIDLTEQDTQKSLAALLRSKDPSIRYRAAIVIHELRVRSARDELKRAIFLEEDPQVRDAMEQAYITCVHR